MDEGRQGGTDAGMAGEGRKDGCGSRGWITPRQGQADQAASGAERSDPSLSWAPWVCLGSDGREVAL